MEYNKQFLNEFISYIESTYTTIENLVDKIISREIISKIEIDEKIQIISEDYANIIKLMDFCKTNDNIFTVDLENAVNVLNVTMEAVINDDIVLLCDYLYHSMCGELMLIFKEIDHKLAQQN